MTRDEVITTINIMYEEKRWCREGVQNALKRIEKAPEALDIESLAKHATSSMALFWGKDIGHHDLMRPQLVDAEDFYWWAYWIGDVEFCFEKLKSIQFLESIRDVFEDWNEEFPAYKLNIPQEVKLARGHKKYKKKTTKPLPSQKTQHIEPTHNGQSRKIIVMPLTQTERKDS